MEALLLVHVDGLAERLEEVGREFHAVPVRPQQLRLEPADVLGVLLELDVDLQTHHERAQVGLVPRDVVGADQSETLLAQHPCQVQLPPVSYTHLTLPTIY